MPRWRRGLHDEARGWPGGGAVEGGRRGAAGDQAAPLCWVAVRGFRLRRCCWVLLCGDQAAPLCWGCCAGNQTAPLLLGLLCGDQAAPLCWAAVRGFRLRRCCRVCWVGIRRRRCSLGCGARDQAAPLFAGFAVRGTGLCRCCWICCIDLVVLLCGVDLVGCIGRRCGGEGGSSVWVGSRIRSSTGSGGFPRATCLP